ncbi:MarR family winged helix-turn-helix transcriptional regulator [Sphingomonas sp. MMS24-J13]|uniref:MarR family winged helix-turn-helix transcriptional regulator n=1 Tax=Sphingomonas sp. MMS24-J13 TaxID=3238686 RepID=UPI003851782F
MSYDTDHRQVTGGPRSEKRRGPRGTDSAGRAPPPDGGYDTDVSNRHLISYHEQFGDGSENDGFYNATRAMVVAARRWRKLANERVKAVGQTMARWETLFLVAFADVDLTQSELARLISVEGPTMVRMLDVLARDGLIERSQSESDRRVTINRITPAGLQVIAQIMGVTNNLRRELLSDIDPERLAICVDVLNQILGRLDEMR